MTRALTTVPRSSRRGPRCRPATGRRRPAGLRPVSRRPASDDPRPLIRRRRPTACPSPPRSAPARSRRSAAISSPYSGRRNSTSARGVGLGRRRGQERRQIGAHRLAVGVAILALRRQRLHHDALQLGRHARSTASTAGRRADRARARARRRSRRGGSAARVARDREQLAPGQQLPQQDPGRVQIGAPVERARAAPARAPGS